MLHSHSHALFPYYTCAVKLIYFQTDPFYTVNFTTSMIRSFIMHKVNNILDNIVQIFSRFLIFINN